MCSSKECIYLSEMIFESLFTESMVFQPFVNPYCKVFDPEKMSRQVERQLEIESMDRVMVDSVVPPPQLTPDVLSAVSYFLKLYIFLRINI